MQADRELLQMALDALNVCNMECFLTADYENTVTAAIAALRERLAPPARDLDEEQMRRLTENGAKAWAGVKVDEPDELDKLPVAYLREITHPDWLDVCDRDAPGAFPVYADAPERVQKSAESEHVAPQQPLRMLTESEVFDAVELALGVDVTSLSIDTRACIVEIQRAFARVNGLTLGEP